MKTVHILYSGSAAGSLRHFMQTNGIKDEIFVVSDDLSVGPLSLVDNRGRYLASLLKQTASAEFSVVECEEVAERLVGSWPKPEEFAYKKIVIWHSTNAPEQMMLRLSVATLTQCELYEIDLSSARPEMRATAEYTPVQLGVYLGTEKNILSEQKSTLAAEWDSLCSDEELIRIWQNDAIKSVAESYYDKNIIEACSNTFQPVARVVGTVMGENKQVVSDTFIAYRLHELIRLGQLEYKGILGSFRTCIVKTNSST